MSAGSQPAAGPRREASVEPGDLQKEEAGASEIPVVYRRFSDIEAKAIRWLWPDRIARGKVSLLAGNPGLGKSQVTAQMAAVVTTGGTWPVDQSACERGSVVFLSAEDDAADTIQPRLEAAGADLSRVFVLDAVRFRMNDGSHGTRGFDLTSDLAKLGSLLTALKDVALVVVDPITAYLGGTDSHKNADVRAILAPLSDLAAQSCVAIVGVSHLNKSRSADALMRVTGSLGFVAASRAAYLVAQDPEDRGSRLFLPMKNNIGRDQTGLRFTIEGCSTAAGLQTSRLVWDSEIVTTSANDAVAAALEPSGRSAVKDAGEFLVQLLENGPMAASEIYAQAAEAGYAKRTILRAKTALQIRPTKTAFDGGWSWALPPKVSNQGEAGQPQTMDTFDQDRSPWPPSERTVAEPNGHIHEHRAEEAPHDD